MEFSESYKVITVQNSITVEKSFIVQALGAERGPDLNPWSSDQKSTALPAVLRRP